MAQNRKYFTIVKLNGSEQKVVADELVVDGEWMKLIRIDEPGGDSLAALPTRTVAAVVRNVAMIIPSDA